MLKQIAIAAIAAAVPLSPVVGQEQKVASVAGIEAALGACLSATGTAGVDEAKLTERGFARGKIEADGKAVASELGFYGQADNAAIIITMANPKPICTVIARIPSIERFPDTVEAINGALQSKPIRQEGNEVTWRHGAAIVQLAATGTREKPSIRTVVMALQEEKK